MTSALRPDYVPGRHDESPGARLAALSLSGKWSECGACLGTGWFGEALSSSDALANVARVAPQEIADYERQDELLARLSIP